MSRKSYLKLFLSALLFVMFIYPVQSELSAFTNNLQDSTRHGKMDHSKMNREKTDHGNMDHGKMGGMKSDAKMQSDRKMKSDMQTMHKNMMNKKMTGDPDYDFASMMIEHHKGAVNMSKKEVNMGKDQQMKTMAKKVINDQNKEIKELQAFVKKNKPSKTNDNDMTGSSDKQSSSKSMMDKMNNMNEKMQNMQMKGNQDQDYASMMIMHHQQAVDMATEYMNNGKNEDLKKMAQRMIDENKDQINKLKDWQGSHK